MSWVAAAPIPATVLGSIWWRLVLAQQVRDPVDGLHAAVKHDIAETCRADASGPRPASSCAAASIYASPETRNSLLSRPERPGPGPPRARQATESLHWLSLILSPALLAPFRDSQTFLNARFSTPASFSAFRHPLYVQRACSTVKQVDASDRPARRVGCEEAHYCTQSASSYQWIQLSKTESRESRERYCG